MSARTPPRSTAERPPMEFSPLTFPPETQPTLELIWERKQRRSQSAVSRQRAFVHPVHVEQALRKQPRAVLLHEGVLVAQRGHHQASIPVHLREAGRRVVVFGAPAIRGL